MEQKARLAISFLLQGEVEPLYKLVRADLDSANTAFINKHGNPKTPLGKFATQRRELLKQVLPILPIADRCTLTDRFLVV